jgi:hypothetical protein
MYALRRILSSRVGTWAVLLKLQQGTVTGGHFLTLGRTRTVPGASDKREPGPGFFLLGKDARDAHTRQPRAVVPKKEFGR